MSHTYWDPKGMVKKRPGGYTYYGGNTNLSQRYKERYIPHYDPKTSMANVDSTDEISVLKQSCNWNTYQKRMWYQDQLDHTNSNFEHFPGLHAEWRHQDGELEKSFRNQELKTSYDFQVKRVTLDANGVAGNTQQMRTEDHTEIQKLRRDMEEKEYFDIDGTGNFSPKDEDNNATMTLSSRRSSNASNPDISYFNEGVKTMSRPSTSSAAIPSCSSPTKIPMPTHPAINPRLCRKNPKEQFRKNDQYSLFASKMSGSLRK
jgi:hypothetical protein